MKTQFRIHQQTLLKILKSNLNGVVRYKDTSILTCVNLQVVDWCTVKFASTEGSILIVNEVTVSEIGGSLKLNVNISQAFAKMLTATLKTKNAFSEALVTINENRKEKTGTISVKIDDFTYTSQLTQGRYPQYEKLVNTKNHSVAVSINSVHLAVLLKALDNNPRTHVIQLLMSEDKNEPVYLKRYGQGESDHLLDQILLLMPVVVK